MWRIGSYHAMRKATGMDVMNASPKPMSTRDSDAQTCSSKMPLSSLLTNAAPTSAGGAKTAGSWLEATSHNAIAQANEMSTQTALGIFAQIGFFFSCMSKGSFLSVVRRGCS